jgi:hypothetical protein
MIEHLRAAVFAAIDQAIDAQKHSSWSWLDSGNREAAHYERLRAEGMEIVRIQLEKDFKKWVDADE